MRQPLGLRLPPLPSMMFRQIYQTISNRGRQAIVIQFMKPNFPMIIAGAQTDTMGSLKLNVLWSKSNYKYINFQK